VAKKRRNIPKYDIARFKNMKLFGEKRKHWSEKGSMSGKNRVVRTKMHRLRDK
jgi:hypothetical protein